MDGVDGRLVALEPSQIATQIREMLGDEVFLKQLREAAMEKPTNYPEDIEELCSYAE